MELCLGWKSGKRRVESGEYVFCFMLCVEVIRGVVLGVESEEWRVKSEEWRVKSGEWRVEMRVEYRGG